MRIESLRRPLWVAGALTFAAVALLPTLYLVEGWRHVETPAVLGDDLSRLQRAQAVALLRPSDDAVIWRRLGGRITVAAVKTLAVGGNAGLETLATFYEEDQQFCGAILRDRARRQYLVKVGETIQGWRVARITTEGVAISQGGAEFFIKLPSAAVMAVAAVLAENPVAAAPAPQARADADTSARIPAAAPLVASQSAAPEAPQAADPNVVSRVQLQLYVRRLGSILAQGQLAPEHNAAGEVVGLRVAKLDDNAVAAARGFKQGDLIREVYSTKLTDVSQLPILARQIWAENPPTITVLVNRDGQDQQVVYRLQ